MQPATVLSDHIFQTFLNPTATLRCRYHYYPHFMNEDPHLAPECQEPGFRFRRTGANACALNHYVRGRSWAAVIHVCTATEQHIYLIAPEKCAWAADRLLALSSLHVQVPGFQV